MKHNPNNQNCAINKYKIKDFGTRPCTCPPVAEEKPEGYRYDHQEECHLNKCGHWGYCADLCNHRPDCHCTCPPVAEEKLTPQAMTKNNTTEWEDKWEEEYGWLKRSHVTGAQLYDHTGVKAFIHETITQARLQARKDTLESVRELISSNTEGTFTDEAGYDCWYIDDLLNHLTTLEHE